MTANVKIFERLGKRNTPEVVASAVLGPSKGVKPIGKNVVGAVRACASPIIKHV